ncbi:MAG: precorrin-8X methylmutase [Vulcanococcus sp.]
MPDAAAGFDHPIFSESIRLIRQALDPAVLEPWPPLEQEVLLRLIHSSGDLSLAADLRCSPNW